VHQVWSRLHSVACRKIFVSAKIRAPPDDAGVGSMVTTSVISFWSGLLAGWHMLFNGHGHWRNVQTALNLMCACTSRAADST